MTSLSRNRSVINNEYRRISHPLHLKAIEIQAKAIPTIVMTEGLFLPSYYLQEIDDDS